MFRFLPTSTLLVALLAHAACKEKQANTTSRDDAAVPPPQIDARPVTLVPQAERPQHFAFLTAAKDSLLFADIAGTRESLRWIAQPAPESKTHESWKEYEVELQSIAKTAEESESIAELANSVASFALSCGACHSALGARPAVEVKEPKHRSRDFHEHMAGHKWALDKMWAGLATPSDAHWIEGAKLLADAPTHLRSLSAYGDDADKAMELATEVHGLAASATRASTPSERVEILGKFLAACAECHALPGSKTNDN